MDEDDIPNNMMLSGCVSIPHYFNFVVHANVDVVIYAVVIYMYIKQPIFICRLVTLFSWFTSFLASSNRAWDHPFL